VEGSLTVDAPALTSDLVRRLLYRRDVAVARHRAALARSLALTDSELVALNHVAERGELSPTAIGRLLGLSSGGTTALVQRLERAGHLARQPHPDDRRSTLLRLTPATAKRLEAAESSLLEGLADLAARFSAPEQACVAEFLTELAALSEQRLDGRRADAASPAQALTRPVPSLWA
jgi:DNA-binding MarR family transcriptional regulator